MFTEILKHWKTIEIATAAIGIGLIAFAIRELVLGIREQIQLVDDATINTGSNGV